jgi:hypothetical protein
MQNAIFVPRRAATPRSRYTIESRPGLLCLIDQDDGRSVTNDAALVIADLVQKGYDLSSTRVLYRDTQGVWDELLTRDGSFAGFRSINATTIDAAIDRAARV